MPVTDKTREQIAQEIHDLSIGQPTQTVFFAQADALWNGVAAIFFESGRTESEALEFIDRLCADMKANVSASWGDHFIIHPH